jgi:hypothetical protein
MKIRLLLLVCMFLAFSSARPLVGALLVRVPSEEDTERALMLLTQLQHTSEIKEVSFVLSSDQSRLIQYGIQIVNGMNHLLVYEDAGKWFCFVVYEWFGGGGGLVSHSMTYEEKEKGDCWKNRFASLQDD